MHALRALTIWATATLTAGCLNQIIPRYDNAGDMSAKTAVGTPPQDLAYTYAPDPTTDGGVAVHYALIQAQLDSLGCTTSACHGVTQVPVISAHATTDAALKANYFDLLSGCADGSPDPSDCIVPRKPSMSLLLVKTCATSGVDHAGGKPFADDTASIYQEWEAWIAADAPY